MKFELTLVTSDGTGKDGKVAVKYINKIEAENLVQLLHQVNFVVINLQRMLHEEAMKEGRVDDIPF